MLDVDFAIGAAGSSLWERCFLGLPTIVCSLADNQLQTALDLASKQVIYFIGSDLELSIELYYKAILKLSTDDSLLASLTKNSLSLFSSEPSFRAKSYIVDTVRQAILQQQ
jgi:UDP-2,4-diacetamido-2,4,6-trideoxy-beta-L-altropyranose hydrolase